MPDREAKTKVELRNELDNARQQIARLESELQELRAAGVRNARRMHALQTLAGGIAHDFNNLLTAIAGYTSLLLLTVRTNDPKHEDIAGIKRAADRAREITRQLLIFSQRCPVNRELLSLNEIVSQAAGALQASSAAQNIRVATTLSPDLCDTLADRQLILHVIDNLLANACEALPDGGQITVETRNVELDASVACLSGTPQPGPYVMLSVGNTGPAISTDHLDLIWEPCFTTKAKHKGMGLAIVYAVVNKHNGYVSVENEANQGTVFRIYLPVLQPE